MGAGAPGSGVGRHLQRRAHLGGGRMERHIEFHRFDQPIRRTIVLKTDGAGLFGAHDFSGLGFGGSDGLEWRAGKKACRSMKRRASGPIRMSDRFDIVVAGAGHNSLVAAAYLAKAGYRCLVLEGRSVLGGNVVTEELTLPGFRHDSCGTAHVILQDSPMMRNDELGLVADYGLEYIHPGDRLPRAVPRRQLADAVPRHRAHHRAVREVLQEGRRRLPAHDRRIRRHQAVVRCRVLHADRLRQADQRPAQRASRRPEMAAAPGPVGLGDHPRQFRGRSLPLLHAVDGVPDRHAAGMADDRAARLFAGLGPPALELVHPEGRLRRAHRNPGAPDRGSRRRRADQQDGRAPDRRERQMRRRRMRRRLELSRRQGRALDHPHQASDRHGAARRSGPTISSRAWRPGRAGRRCSCSTTRPASR